MQAINNQSTEFSTPSTIREGKTVGWRIRAKLAVRGTPQRPKIGLFRPGTHDVEDLIDCPDHHPAINRALTILRTQKLIPFNEITLEGSLRYVQLTVSRQSGKVQLVLVSNGEGQCTELAKSLQRSHDWHSIWINTQTGSTNTIFGAKWMLFLGPRHLEESLLGIPAFFHPACFIQAHLDLYEEILQDIKDLVMDGQVAEFYAGVGSISRSIDRPSVLVESNPFAEECFYKSNPPGYLQFITGKSEEHADLMQDILIVDPPRKGLDPKLIKAIERAPLKQILYLSCNPKTLRRDLKHLQKIDWKIKDIKGYKLFPNTPHVEILVNLVSGF